MTDPEDRVPHPHEPADDRRADLEAPRGRPGPQDRADGDHGPAASPTAPARPDGPGRTTDPGPTEAEGCEGGTVGADAAEPTEAAEPTRAAEPTEPTEAAEPREPREAAAPTRAAELTRAAPQEREEGTADAGGDDRGTPDDVPVAVAVAAPPVRRAARVRGIVSRSATALLVVGLTAGAAWAGTVRPAVEPEAAPADPVPVPPSAATVVCPGPLRLPTEPGADADVAYDPQFDPAPEASSATLAAVTLLGASGRVADLGAPDGADGTDLRPVGDVAVTSVAEVDGPLEVRGEPTDGGGADVAASLVVRTTEGDLRGLAATSCRRAGPETWLVGGGTALGSSARLVLQNPGRTPALATVTLWGPSGPVELAGAPEFLVPPGAERVVLLEGVAAEQRLVVTRVTSSGGLLTAYLQDSALRGLTPAGVDLVASAAPPATQQVVPGVSVTATQPGGADATVLRLLAPDAATTARITVLGPDGPVDLPGAEQVELAAGTVLDVPLGGLATGTYTVAVEADAPVVAGAMLTRGEGVGAAEEERQEPLERAWVPGAGAVTDGAVALPAGVDGRLALGVAPGRGGSAEVTLDVVGADGAVVGSRELELEAMATTTVRLDELLGPDETTEAAAVVVRTEDTRVRWSVVLLERRPEGNLVAALTPVAGVAGVTEALVRTR